MSKYFNYNLSLQCIVPKAVYRAKKSAPEDGRILSPETCRADLKRLINEKVIVSCWLLTSLYNIIFLNKYLSRNNKVANLRACKDLQ